MLQTLALTRDLTAPATFLQLTTFQRHSASSVPDSSKTHPKYLNSDTCSNHIPSTEISYSNPSSSPNTITLLLPASTFRPFLLHTSTKSPTITLRFCSESPHKTKSSAYKRPSKMSQKVLRQMSYKFYFSK